MQTVPVYTEQEINLMDKQFIKNNINWENEFTRVHFSGKFLCKYKDFFNHDEWKTLSEYQTLDEKTIRELADYVDWHRITLSQKLSEPFIEEFLDHMTWEDISIGQKLSDKFIEKYRFMIDWDELSFKHDLSIKFLRRWKEDINWRNFSQDYRDYYNPKFFREFASYLDWEEIYYSGCFMTEKFMREFRDYVPWSIIAEEKKFSIDFVREFKDKIDFLDKWDGKILKEFPDKCV